MSYRQRVKRAVESFGNAAEAIGPITQDMSLFAVTRGQWSMLDAILYVLSQTGPAAVSLWTWTVADYEMEAMCGLMARQEITAGFLIIDASADRRNAQLINQWRDRFGEKTVKVVKNHAKLATVTTDQYRLLLRGSMNLNQNPRLEQFDLTEGDAAYDLVRRLEDELPVMPRKYSNADAEQATGVSKAWEQATLDMFKGLPLKHWSPSK